MATQDSGLAPLKKPEGATLVGNSYIVVFKETVEDNDVKPSMQTVTDIVKSAGGINAVKREYNIGKSFRGFSGTFDEETLTKIRKLSFIKYIECDATVYSQDSGGSSTL